jgi:hypothetical protein
VGLHIHFSIRIRDVENDPGFPIGLRENDGVLHMFVSRHHRAEESHKTEVDRKSAENVSQFRYLRTLRTYSILFYLSA